MLVQSHLSYIDLLPSLPDALENGSVSGLLARGGIELSLEWKYGSLLEVEVLSKAGKKCKLRYNNKTAEFNTEVGRIYRLTPDLFQQNY